jgi:two-component system NarL family response regulator
MEPKTGAAPAALRILLVDEHKLTRAALRAFLAGELGGACVAEAGGGGEALERVAEADIVILGVNTPDMGGAEAAKQLVNRRPGLKVIALSAYADQRFVLGMLGAGAVGYIVKADAAEELLRALRAVAQGQIYLSPTVSARLAESACGRAKGGQPGLAPRERQVLALLAEGLHSPAIGRRLSIAPATVEVHRRNIMRKVGVRGIAGLTKYAIREGIASV